MRDDEPLGTAPLGADPLGAPLRADAANASPTPLQLALAFAAVYVVWGSTYLGIRVGVQTLPPFLLAGTRSFSAGLVMLVVLRVRGARAPNWVEWRRAALAGTLLLGAGSGLVTWAEKSVPSNLAALSIAAMPSHIALLDWLRPGGQRPAARALAGVLLGGLGILLLLRPDPHALGDTLWLPRVALVLAGFSWAVGSLYSRYQQQYPNAAVAGALQMLCGGAVLLLVSLSRGELSTFQPSQVSGQSWFALAYLSVFGSMLAFSCFNWLVGVTTPARLSTTAYVNPVVAVVLGWFVLGEPLHPVSLVGGLLIVCAVVVMTTRSRRVDVTGKAA